MSADTLVIIGPSKSGKSLIGNLIVGHDGFRRTVHSQGFYGHTLSVEQAAVECTWVANGDLQLNDGTGYPVDREAAAEALVWIDTPLKQSNSRWPRVTELSLEATVRTGEWGLEWSRRARSECGRTAFGLIVIPERGLDADSLQSLRRLVERFPELGNVAFRGWVNQRHAGDVSVSARDAHNALRSVFSTVEAVDILQPQLGVLPGQPWNHVLENH